MGVSVFLTSQHGDGKFTVLERELTFSVIRTFWDLFCVL